MLNVLKAAVVAVACSTSVVAAGQTVEFRIVEREGQTAITSSADAQLNFAVQARIVGAPAETALGNFAFNVVVQDEPESFGTLVKGLISNTDGTYVTTIGVTAAVGRGGVARQYSYLAGINSQFNGSINTSGGTFTNTAQQEIGIVAGSPIGGPLLGAPGIDVNDDGTPDTYTGSGSSALLDPVAGATYFARGGGWIDVYRFRYTPSNLSTRMMRFDLQSVAAQSFASLAFANGLWGAWFQSNVAVAVQPTDISVSVSDSGACCDVAGMCTTTSGTGCAGVFLVGSACTPSPCLPGGACCTTNECRVTFAAGCTSSWTLGGSCMPSNCNDPGACCFSSGPCTLVLHSACSGVSWTAGGTCSPNPCPQPSGRCCDAMTGACTFVLQVDCNTTWTAGGSCTPNTCPAPSGRCCIAITGVCTFVTEMSCSGTWTIGGACSPNPCPQPGGRCCSAMTGACTLEVQASCTGAWMVGGSCTPNMCAVPGACCALSGTCTLVIQSSCSGNSWTQGSCTPNVCPQLGACCLISGACSLTQANACLTAWTLGTTCSPNPCPLLGSCCTAAAQCSLTTQGNCSEVWTSGQACSPNPCLVLTTCCNATSGTCTLAGTSGSILYTYTYANGNAGYARDRTGGTVEAITATFSPVTKRLVFDATFSGSTTGGPLITRGFWLVLDNGPNPKHHPGELAIFYFDASTLAAPKLTVYAYNGSSANDSWSDGDPLTVGA